MGGLTLAGYLWRANRAGDSLPLLQFTLPPAQDKHRRARGQADLGRRGLAVADRGGVGGDALGPLRGDVQRPQGPGDAALLGLRMQAQIRE